MENVAQLTLEGGTDLSELLADDARRSHLEREILPAYIRQCRWYRSKNRKLKEVVFEASGPLSGEPVTAWFTVVKVSFDEGEPERYALPISTSPPGDAALDENFRATLFRISMQGTSMHLGTGMLQGIPFSAAEKNLNEHFSSALLGGEQSNTSFVFSTGHFMKLYRHFEEGLHPEPEILKFLKEVRYANVPAFRASLEWQRPNQPVITAAMVQDRIEADDNAWEYLLSRLGVLFSDSSFPEKKTLPGDLTAWTRLLGQRTAGLHLALASRHDAEAFAPEPFVLEDLTAVRVNTAHLLNSALGIAQNRSAEDRDVIQKSLESLARMEKLLSENATPDSGRNGLGNKIRTHSDLHLGQILRVHNDICFIDFEGEPARPLTEKRRKHCPLRDVAGMLRSFHYASHVALSSIASPSHSQNAFDSAQSFVWSGLLGESFLEGYDDLLKDSDLLPQNAVIRETLLDFFVLEKAVYELHYELNNRPDWVEIPLRGLLDLIQQDDSVK